jgi:hypothetical protein
MTEAAGRIKYVDATAGANVSHVLQVAFKVTKIRVSLNRKLYIEAHGDVRPLH